MEIEDWIAVIVLVSLAIGGGLGFLYSSNQSLQESAEKQIAAEAVKVPRKKKKKSKSKSSKSKSKSKSKKKNKSKSKSKSKSHVKKKKRSTAESTPASSLDHPQLVAPRTLETIPAEVVEAPSMAPKSARRNPVPENPPNNAQP